MEGNAAKATLIWSHVGRGEPLRGPGNEGQRDIALPIWLLCTAGKRLSWLFKDRPHCSKTKHTHTYKIKKKIKITNKE